jgi:hypothetical protein
MPYIPKINRQILDERKVQDVGSTCTVGDLTYVLYTIVTDYFNSNMRYQTGAEILGALEAAKQEFYRRQLGPYEDSKIADNGDIE